MAERAHTQHTTAGSSLADARFGVGVRAMDGLSSDSPLRLEQLNML